jgi:tetratricopeptide (TPR) repeat protein
MNTMPWNYWAEDGNPKSDTIKVINTIESVLDKDPNHPLAIHLYIHAVEASSDPGRAEEAADRLADLVPGAGHLVHMPSHIYWRVGRYEDASLANIAAAKVDEEYIAQCNAQGFYPALYYPHNVHFLWAASTMEGMSELSIESAIKVSNYVLPEQIRNIPFLEFFHTIPLLSYVRFAKWDRVFSYERPDDDFKFSNSIFNYALSVAHAANGNLLEANRFQSMILNDIESEEVNAMVMAGHPTKSLMKIASLLASGSIDMYSSKYNEAIASFKEAVIIQDTLPYTEPPFWYYPTRQTLGHALLMNKSFEEAALVFKRDLKDYPRNGWSYFGLHVAENELNNQEESIEALNKFKEIWGRADISINSSIVY